MWNEIGSPEELDRFMERMYDFHDSCIKEMTYVSGASVGDKLYMYPLNDRRTLRVVIQRQFEDDPMIEMEFSKLRLLKLRPVDEEYTCEIFAVTMIMRDGAVFWFDSGHVTDGDIEGFDGTCICAEKFRWRPIDGHMGDEPFCVPDVPG